MIKIQIRANMCYCFAIMRINDLLKQASKKIDRKEATLLLANVIRKDEAYILAHADRDADDKAEAKFNTSVNERANNKPIAYILGKQPFCGLEFKVNKHTLIPRPETEQLVHLVTANINKYLRSDSTRAARRANERNKIVESVKGESRDEKNRKLNKVVIIDIGTGSGCIACSLKKQFEIATVIAGDISPAALSVVKHNDKKLSTGIKVIHSDLFSGALRQIAANTLKKLKRADLHIIANLPYLPCSDRNDMQKDVVDYEPSNALFADDDGMELIKKCMKQLFDFLYPHSPFKISWTLYFEMDPRQKYFLRSYAKSIFNKSQIQVKKDLSGRDRFIIISNRG